MRPNDSKPTATITVELPGASYAILIKAGLLERTEPALADLLTGRKIFILSDTTVWKLWGRKLLASLKKHHPTIVLIPPGERYKRLATVEKIADRLSAQGAERSSILLAFGGGVVGDIGGFVASVFLRGMDYVQIPTTLLAQVDSAIGGKTGVNLGVGKNLVGTFYQPRRVLSDPRVLKTLPPRELRAGLFEAVKCAVIGDPVLFEFLLSERDRILDGDPAALTGVIRACAALKGRIVSLDEKEGDLRRVLNFGHTVGHALEAATRYRRFLHGEAVAWGMLAATHLAVERSKLSASDAERIASLVAAYGPVPSLKGMDPKSVARHMAVDKKVRAGKLHFVLPRRIGAVEVVAGIEPQEAIGALRRLIRENPWGQKKTVARISPSPQP